MIIFNSSSHYSNTHTFTSRRAKKRSQRSINANDEDIFTSFNNSHAFVTIARFESIANVWLRTSTSFCNNNSNEFIDDFSTNDITNRERLSNYEKIISILNSIRNVHWTLKIFLIELRRHSHTNRVRKLHNQMLNFAYINMLKNTDFENIIDVQRKKSILVNVDWKWINDDLCQKLNALCRHTFFDKFKTPFHENDIGNLKFFTSLMTIICHRAFDWIRLCEQIFDDDIFSMSFRNEFKSSDDRTRISIWSAMILSICCKQKYSIRSINVFSILDLYLYQNDVRRRVLITFKQLKICMFYKTLQRRMRDLVFIIENKIQIIEQSTAIVIIYDNFDFMIDRRDERTENAQIMRSITIALLFQNRELTKQFLSMKMWRLKISSLSTIRFVEKLKFDEINKKIIAFQQIYQQLTSLMIDSIASFEIKHSSVDSIRRRFRRIFLIDRHVRHRNFFGE